MAEVDEAVRTIKQVIGRMNTVQKGFSVYVGLAVIQLVLNVFAGETQMSILSDFVLFSIIAWFVFAMWVRASGGTEDLSV